MMRSDYLNLHVYPVRTEMADPSSHVCSMDEDESKGIIVDECYTEEDESEFVHKNINKKKTQIMRQSMRNLQLQMKCRAILTY